MKKILLLTAALLFMAVLLSGAEKKSDPSQLFYRANGYYEKQSYDEAIGEYLKIVGSGVENGSLYYNLGNAFLKNGKIGYAILYYEKARRLIPQDSDLKSNLSYARSLVGYSGYEAPRGSSFMRIIKKPFNDFNLNALAILTASFYLILIIMLSAHMITPFFMRRFRPVFFLVVIVFVLSLPAFCIRYYDEQILTHGIIIEKEADAKYEPIDKSTTYYKLQEGSEAVILKARSGWTQIRRPDGKIAWIKKEAIDRI